MELSSQSKILPHGKVKLVDEYLLEGIQIVLLVEDKHGLLVVDRVNRTETQRTDFIASCSLAKISPRCLRIETFCVSVIACLLYCI